MPLGLDSAFLPCAIDLAGMGDGARWVLERYEDEM